MYMYLNNIAVVVPAKIALHKCVHANLLDVHACVIVKRQQFLPDHTNSVVYVSMLERFISLAQFPVPGGLFNLYLL